MALLVPKPQARIQIAESTGHPTNYMTRFLTAVTDAINGTSVSGVNQVVLGTGAAVSSGAGSPEGVVTGSPGDIYTSTTGGVGATFYVKETGVGTKTGWQAK